MLLLPLKEEGCHPYVRYPSVSSLPIIAEVGAMRSIVATRKRFLTQGTTMSALHYVPQPIFELLGVAGFIFYMASYALLQLGKITGHSYSYTVMNLIAASLVLLSLIHQFNLASVLIQLAWIIISVCGLCRIGIINYRENRQRDQPVAEFV